MNPDGGVYDNKEYNKLVEEHKQIVLDIEELDIAIRVAECKRNGDALNDHLHEMRNLQRHKIEIEGYMDVIRSECQGKYYAEGAHELYEFWTRSPKKKNECGVHRSWWRKVAEGIGR